MLLSGFRFCAQAAASYGCEVDTLTLSVEQKALAEERVRERGLEGRVRVHLMDYRDIPASWAHQFDAFLSVEMLEHVGSKVSVVDRARGPRLPRLLACVRVLTVPGQYYERYFEIVDFALKRTGATAVVTCSSFPEGRYSTYQYVSRPAPPLPELPTLLLSLLPPGALRAFHFRASRSRSQFTLRLLTPGPLLPPPLSLEIGPTTSCAATCGRTPACRARRS